MKRMQFEPFTLGLKNSELLKLLQICLHKTPTHNHSTFLSLFCIFFCISYILYYSSIDDETPFSVNLPAHSSYTHVFHDNYLLHVIKDYVY